MEMQWQNPGKRPILLYCLRKGKTLLLLRIIDQFLYSTMIIKCLILIDKFKKGLQEFILSDQCELLLKRQSKDNMRVVLDEYKEYLKKHNEKQAIVIFLDNEKAFDNLNWPFLFKVLEDMDFDENFISLSYILEAEL